MNACRNVLWADLVDADAADGARGAVPVHALPVGTARRSAHQPALRRPGRWRAVLGNPLMASSEINACPGAVKQVFFDGAAVEPGDRAQRAGNGRSGARPLVSRSKAGPDLQRRNCMSFAEFTDPDGNLWQLREVRRERDAEDIDDG